MTSADRAKELEIWFAQLERKCAHSKKDKQVIRDLISELAGVRGELESRKYQYSQEREKVRRLIRQHDRHWQAIGICTGGVDCPVDDEFGNAECIKREIEKIRKERDRYKAALERVSNWESEPEAKTLSAGCICHDIARPALNEK
jgi:hypothetical protein